MIWFSWSLWLNFTCISGNDPEQGSNVWKYHCRWHFRWNMELHFLKYWAVNTERLQHLVIKETISQVQWNQACGKTPLTLFTHKAVGIEPVTSRAVGKWSGNRVRSKTRVSLIHLHGLKVDRPIILRSCDRRVFTTDTNWGEKWRTEPAALESARFTKRD